MASNSHGVQVTIQVVLGLVIIALVYWLYVSITEPYEAVRRQEEVTEQTRARMLNVRSAMIRYEEVNERYVTTLDSLVDFVQTDSLYSVEGDSIFGAGFVPDSLPFSPRTGKRFLLSVNDTARVMTYLLKDPDSDDQIGTLEPDVTKLNAASWE
jgi:hypothetical protein